MPSHLVCLTWGPKNNCWQLGLLPFSLWQTGEARWIFHSTVSSSFLNSLWSSFTNVCSSFILYRKDIYFNIMVKLLMPRFPLRLALFALAVKSLAEAVRHNPAIWMNTLYPVYCTTKRCSLCLFVWLDLEMSPSSGSLPDRLSCRCVPNFKGVVKYTRSHLTSPLIPKRLLNFPGDKVAG